MAGYATAQEEGTPLPRRTTLIGAAITAGRVTGLTSQLISGVVPGDTATGDHSPFTLDTARALHP